MEESKFQNGVPIPLSERGYRKEKEFSWKRREKMKSHNSGEAVNKQLFLYYEGQIVRFKSENASPQLIAFLAQVAQGLLAA